ncbi:MAG: GDSL-type esterase/lipase family protein [Eubacterium sp.]|jgi:lysophospholipase L1-like esterase|nr:GDSL-type esterase/lipase family protein [Eubacterium sp.]MCI2197440.1 GDSL-type esterase/lipase family protein [Eubacterium sp.]
MTERRRVLFYGDSNTYGYDPRGFLGGRYPSELIWVSRVREALKDSWTVMTDGMNGREIPSSPLTMQALDRTLKRCAPLDLFAVMLGSNDLLFSDPDPQKAADKMERMLEHVTVVLERENQKAQGKCENRRAQVERENQKPQGKEKRENLKAQGKRENQKVQAEILLIAPPLDYSDGERLKKASVRLGVLYRELAERKHYHFLDVGSQNFSLAFDGLHFSEEGHRQMGEFAAGALAKL